jgi:RNA polymerase sigma-70 factor (ECF subfamily)
MLELIAAFCSDMQGNHASPPDSGPDAEVNGSLGFESVLRLYHARIYNLAYRLLGNPEEAADLTQDAFVRAYRAYPRFRGSTEAIYPWLCRIAVNGCKNKFKEIGRRRRYEAFSLDEPVDAGDSMLAFEPGDESADPAGVFEQHEMETKIQEAIQSLPPEYRVVVVLRDMQGLSYQEVADATGLTTDVVKVRLFRGRGMLRRRLSTYLTD